MTPISIQRSPLSWVAPGSAFALLALFAVALQPLLLVAAPAAAALGAALALAAPWRRFLAAAPAVRDALAGEQGEGPVGVALGRASLISSAVIATLINALRRLTRRRRSLVVVGGPDVGLLFRLARLDDTLALCPDVDAALARSEGPVAA